jgi:tryptophanyl-tRNA synthetase
MNTKNKVQDIEKRTDYDRTLEEFGISKIDTMIPRIGKEHIFFRRGVVFAHRDFDKTLDRIEQNKNFAIISGRGPSSDLHYGHFILFELVRFLQEKYNCNLFLPLSDDEKFVFRKVDSLNETYKLSLENAIDIFALGFKPDKVHAYISSTTPRIQYLALSFSANQTYNAIKSALGLTGEENVGTVFYSCIQAAHILHPTIDHDLPVVVPVGLDQDVFVRLTRDIARKRKICSPASLYVRFLKGLKGKPMSSSIPESCVFLSDDVKAVKRKIMGAFTGGRTTRKEQRNLGADPDICTIYDMFEKYFVRDDDELCKIREGCKNGDLICGLDCKPQLTEMILSHQKQHNNRKKEVIKNLEKYFDHEIDLSVLENEDDSFG